MVMKRKIILIILIIILLIIIAITLFVGILVVSEKIENKRLSFYIIIFWLLCGILSGILSEQKGDKPIGGFILNILSGPIALIIELTDSNNHYRF